MEKCKFCPKEAKSKAGLAAHMRSHKTEVKDTLESEVPIEPPKEQTALEVPESPKGVVGGGHAVPVPPKKPVELPKPVLANFSKGDKAMDIRTGDRFIVHAVDGERIARQVNQTADGVRWYDRTSLTKL